LFFRRKVRFVVSVVTESEHYTEIRRKIPPFSALAALRLSGIAEGQIYKKGRLFSGLSERQVTDLFC